MLEGLEISEIFKSNLERTLRFDSEFYSKENLGIIEKLIKLPLNNITELVKVSDGNHMSISENFHEVGVPYFRGQDIHYYFIEDSTPICIDKETFDKPVMRRSHLKEGDVLLSIVGTIGGVSLVSSDTDATCSCKLAIFRPIKTDGYFLSAFLKSRYGQNQIKKFTRGAVQMGLILEDMDQIMIPEFSEIFQQKIRTLIQSAKEKSITSIEKYKQAENLLLETIGLNNFEPSKEAVNIKSFKESFLAAGRIDAEYYQKKYVNLIHKVKNYENGHYKLSDIAILKNGSFIPDEFYIEKSNRAFIRIKELSNNRPININDIIYVNDDFKSTNETIVNKNEYVIATIGNTIGKVNLVPEVLDGSFISNNTSKISLKINTDNYYFFELLFRCLVFQEQIQREFTQTAQPKISNLSIEEIILPFVNIEVQTQLNSFVEDSFKLKKQSELMLETAKRAVEVAIEEGEERGMEYMSSVEIINN